MAIVQKAQVAAKLETVEGTKETLAASDGFLAFGPVFNPVIEMHERDPVRESLSKYPSLSGKRSAKLSFDVEMVGSGVAGTAPFWGKLMKACGFSETVQSGVSVTYKPASDSIPSMTLALYMDGLIGRLWGARGNVKAMMEVGKPGILHFEFEGADFEVVDGSMLSGITYSSLLPPVFLSASLTVDSYAALCARVEIDIANKLYKREDLNSSSGHKSVAIVGRNPKGSLDPEMVTVATYDFFGKWRTPGTLGALSLSASGGGGNIVTVSCPKVRYANIAPQDRGGLRTLGIDFEPVLNTGDDEISIALT